jgi:multidrug efflux system membrane fusion protein
MKLMEGKMKKIDYLVFLIMALISIIYLSSCGSEAVKQEMVTKINVRVAPVVEKSMALPISTSGKLYTSTESKLSFKIPGIVAHIYVDEGQSAKKGTLLAALDLIEMEAKVNQAHSAQQKAKRDLERAQRLYADSVVTLEQLQNATTALDIATSDVKVADFNLRYSAIHAPENGKILKRFAEEGELIGSGNPVFLYGVSKDGWVLRAGVTDQQIIQLKVDDKANIEFDAYPDLKFPAKISEIEAVANPYTGTFEVELQLDPSDIPLYSGFVGKVTIIPGIRQNYSVVPIESLIEGDEAEGYVYGANRSNNTATKHKISIGKIVGNRMLVNSGLEDVEEVVTFGAPYLTNSSVINIIE